jgi:prophage DNA circulation protein
MTWRDDLLPAQLNGLTFLYSEVSGKGGRRNVLFEYPGRDAPFIEDLGRRAKQYSVAAFLVGPNYHVDRDRLIDILDSGDALDFQHPYHGSMPVKLLGEYSYQETDQQGGMVSFTFTLVEAGLVFPLIRVASPAQVARLAAIAADVVAKKTKFSLLGAIGAVVSAITNGIGKANSALRKANGKIATGLGLIDNITGAIQDFDKQLTTLLNSPQALMNKLLALKSAVMNLVKDFIPPTVDVDVVTFTPSVADIALEAVLVMNAVEQVAEAIPTPTEQFSLEEAALAAVDLVDKAGTAIYAAESLAAVEMESAAQALEVQTALVANFDGILATPDLDPEILEAMAALKAATVEHFSQLQQQLPNLTTYKPMQTMPSLVVAYELYADAEREAEIVLRNGIRHPGFLPGGVTLEVLAYD